MQLADYLIDPDALALPWSDNLMPLAVIDLGRTPSYVPLCLPPFPVIGLGPSDHPLADVLDTIIEPPVSLAQLTANILRAPHAAAICVQTLRIIERMVLADALVLESLAYATLQGSTDHLAWLASGRPVGGAPGDVRLSRDGETITLVIDRPSSYNAIDRSLRDGLRDAFLVAALDPEIRQVNLRSTGRAFSIGGDLAEFGTTRDPATAHQIRMASLPAASIARCSDYLTVHVQGACIGAGLEIAAFGKFVTATSGSWFQLPELSMGLIPGAGGCVSLTRRIGRRRSNLLVLSGRRIGAATAAEWGLVDALVDD